MAKKVISELSFSDKISGFSKVRVTKPEPDALRSLCGEKVQIDKDGNEFFLIPEHQAKYQAELHPAYKVSKGFLPKELLDKLQEESGRNAGEVTGEDEASVPKKHRGNPNWGKKHIPAETDVIHEVV